MLSDQPITTAKDDLLGRAGFARQVASAMLSCPSDKKGSFGIGLFGGWGSGKTSVLNMVMEAMAEKAAGKKYRGPAPIVIQFNPWQYPAAELLPGQLLSMLAQELQKPSHSERLNKAGRAMGKYAAALQGCAPGDKAADAEGEEDAPKKPKKDALPKSVQERKEKVIKHLRKQEENIYVIMDDIDRLSSRGMRHALQLASAVAGFPHMVYLLSFDREVVVNALTKELNADGWEYLKKFVQAQFTIPAPEEGRLRAILSAYFDAWFDTQPALNFDQAYFAEISPYILESVASIRDVYRFINTFRFQYQTLGNEVNFVDLMAVTALQLHCPQALPWIQDHRDDLLRGGGLAFHSADAEHKQALKREHRQMLLSLGDKAAKTLIPLIGRMFPRYGKDVLDINGEEFGPNLVRMRRICCEEFFDLYFTQSTDGLSITQQEIMRTIQDMDAAALRAYTDGLTQEDRRNAYLSHLPHYLKDIPDDKLPMFFFELLWLSRLPESKTPMDKPFQRSFFHQCCYCALRLLAQMEGGMRARCLREATEKADKLTIPMLVTVLQRILQHNPDADSIEMDEAVLYVHLRKLLNKIHAIALDVGWMDSHKPLPVLEFWKQADAVSFRVYFQRLLQDDRNAALLVSSLIERFDQGMNMEYQYGDMNGRHAFSDEFPPDMAKAAVRRLRGTDAFLTLPEDVRLDCVAFSLMDESLNRVTHQDVLDAYPAWLEGGLGKEPPEPEKEPDAWEEPAAETEPAFADEPIEPEEPEDWEAPPNWKAPLNWEAPEEPENRGAPEEPEAPEAPEVPEVPEVPEEPEAPEIPEAPEEPENRGAPLGREEPDDSDITPRAEKGTGKKKSFWEIMKAIREKEAREEAEENKAARRETADEAKPDARPPYGDDDDDEDYDVDDDSDEEYDDDDEDDYVREKVFNDSKEEDD